MEESEQKRGILYICLTFQGKKKLSFLLSLQFF